MVALANSAAGSYSVRVVPGSYDVYYQWTAGATVPLNSLARLQTAAIAATGTTTLDIDVPSAIVTGTPTINGAPTS